MPRILFITSNRIGDAVLSTGLLRWLVENRRDAQFTIVCGPAAKDLFQAVPRLEKLIVLRKRSWNRHWIELWRECIGAKWDLIVDLRNSVVSRLLIAGKRAYPPLRRAPHRHKVLENAAVLKLDPPPAPYLWADEVTEGAMDWKIKRGERILALGPAANWPPKQWPIENFVELARRMIAPDGLMAGARVLVCAAPHERADIEPLLRSLPREKLIDAVGLDLLAVISFLKRATLFIGNDSGLMHMAAAVGAPTLGLFGPGYEDIYGPYGPRGAIVRTPESREELLARLPSLSAREPNLMGGLTVDMVNKAAGRLLAGLDNHS